MARGPVEAMGDDGWTWLPQPPRTPRPPEVRLAVALTFLLVVLSGAAGAVWVVSAQSGPEPSEVSPDFGLTTAVGATLPVVIVAVWLLAAIVSIISAVFTWKGDSFFRLALMAMMGLYATCDGVCSVGRIIGLGRASRTDSGPAVSSLDYAFVALVLVLPILASCILWLLLTRRSRQYFLPRGGLAS